MGPAAGLLPLPLPGRVRHRRRLRPPQVGVPPRGRPAAGDRRLARAADRPDHLQATCEAIAATSHARTALDRDRAAARQVVADCDRRLGRYRAALDAGADPGVVGHWIAEATAARQAAEVVLHNLAVPPPAVCPEQVRRAIQELGGLLMALDGSDPVLRAQLY